MMITACTNVNCEPAKFVKATIAVVTSNLIKHLKIYHESVYEKFQLEKVSNVSLLLISKLIYILCLYLFFFCICSPQTGLILISSQRQLTRPTALSKKKKGWHGQDAGEAYVATFNC